MDCELYARFRPRIRKRGPAEDFVGRIADFDFRHIQRIAISINSLVAAERDTSPNLKMRGFIDSDLTRLRARYWLVLREGSA
jgi:hypothetical protein